MVSFASREILTQYKTLTWAHQAGLNLVEVTKKNHPKEPLVTIHHNALE